MISRIDGRLPDQLRKITITPHVSEYAEGSVIVEFGRTKVLCTATYETKAPSWLLGTGAGWVTAEYGMLPRSTHTRIKRDKSMTGGRTQEISRLLGRSLRSAVDLTVLNEKQIIIDCDVLNADGGTRTAAVTGGFVALALALKKLHSLSEIKSLGLKHYVAAISVGLLETADSKTPLLDLNYEEDSDIGTDMNFVMNNKNEFIEVQGTAEQGTFSKNNLFSLLEVAESGCKELFIQQEKIVGNFFPLMENK
jgi:ribonuclease PH